MDYIIVQSLWRRNWLLQLWTTVCFQSGSSSRNKCVRKDGLAIIITKARNRTCDLITNLRDVYSHCYKTKAYHTLQFTNCGKSLWEDSVNFIAAWLYMVIRIEFLDVDPSRLYSLCKSLAKDRPGYSIASISNSTPEHTSVVEVLFSLPNHCLYYLESSTVYNSYVVVRASIAKHPSSSSESIQMRKQTWRAWNHVVCWV